MRSTGMLVLWVLVTCGPGHGVGSTTQATEAATSGSTTQATGGVTTGDGATQGSATTGVTTTGETTGGGATQGSATTGVATTGETTGGATATGGGTTGGTTATGSETETSGTESGDGTTLATASSTGEVCEDIEQAPAGEPDEPCDGGGLLILDDDNSVLAGLEWCPVDAIHRYAPVVCPCGGVCRTDDDCGAGQACLCGSFLGNSGYVADECVPADCRTDSDCPMGFECGVSPGICGWGWLLELHCRTPADECVGNSECESGPCSFDPMVMAWRCVGEVICE